MTGTVKQVTILVDAGPVADRQDLDVATRRVKREIEDGVPGVEGVAFQKTADGPAGSKSAAAVVLGTLIADVLPTALEKLIDVLKWWSGRNSACTVILKIGDDELHLTGVAKDQLDRIIQEWTERHKGK